MCFWILASSGIWRLGHSVQIAWPLLWSPLVRPNCPIRGGCCFTLLRQALEEAVGANQKILSAFRLSRFGAEVLDSAQEALDKWDSKVTALASIVA